MNERRPYSEHQAQYAARALWLLSALTVLTTRDADFSHHDDASVGHGASPGHDKRHAVASRSACHVKHCNITSTIYSIMYYSKACALGRKPLSCVVLCFFAFCFPVAVSVPKVRLYGQALRDQVCAPAEEEPHRLVRRRERGPSTPHRCLQCSH